ncbi:MAG: hypothetical protein KIT73_04510 [Burkholderiales bacterium]|nr:hypothetical protein [Burkholderiales bacterium]
MSAPRRIVRAMAMTALAVLPSLVFAAEESTAKELPTNKLERFHMKHAGCQWTNEMGQYMYECLKANFGMNAHWCHNEAMDVYCPTVDADGKAVEAPKSEPAATGAKVDEAPKVPPTN